jgi:hypothetical protein
MAESSGWGRGAGFDVGCGVLSLLEQLDMADQDDMDELHDESQDWTPSGMEY